MQLNFRMYRREVTDVLLSCFYILRGKIMEDIFRDSFVNLNGLVSGTQTWQVCIFLLCGVVCSQALLQSLEACLFALVSISEGVPSSSYPTLAQFISSLCTQFQPISGNMQYSPLYNSLLSLIGEYFYAFD